MVIDQRRPVLRHDVLAALDEALLLFRPLPHPGDVVLDLGPPVGHGLAGPQELREACVLEGLHHLHPRHEALHFPHLEERHHERVDREGRETCVHSLLDRGDRAHLEEGRGPAERPASHDGRDHPLGLVGLAPVVREVVLDEVVECPDA